MVFRIIADLRATDEVRREMKDHNLRHLRETSAAFKDLPMRQALIACLLFFMTSIDARAVDAKPCQVHVILFVPSDVLPPLGYQQRPVDSRVPSSYNAGVHLPRHPNFEPCP